MINKTVYFISFFIIFVFTGLAQELPNVIPPSPTVSNLMHFEEVPVSHYTGQPNISIPLFSKSLSKDLNLNIGLSYNTQGVKIDNRSSWTGTGWSLEAGGVISRTVRGLPDEKQKGHQNPLNGTGVLHNDAFWNYDNIDPLDKAEFIWNANGNTSDQYDYELDLFQFNVLGLSGRFVIIKNNGNLEAKLLSKSQNIKVDITYDSISFELQGFIITDTKGNHYTFDIIEELMSDPFIAVENQNFEQSPQGSGQQFMTKNAWFLSKIETSNSIELVNFEYQDSYVSYENPVSRTENEFINRPSNWTDMKENPYNLAVLPPRRSYAYNSTYGQTKKLFRVNFRDSISLEFGLGLINPETNGASLGTISIRNNNIENKRFAFNYETTDRLWLMNIEEISGTLSNLYVLEYTDKDNLPPFDSPSDDWGYNYTMPVVSNSNCNRTDFDKNAIKKGLLERIIYPTGGVKEFVFEHNTITYNSEIEPSSQSSNPAAVTLTDEEYKDLNPDNWESGGGVSFSFDSNTQNSANGNLNIIPGTLFIEQEQEIIFKRSAYNINFNNCINTEEDILFNSKIEIKDANPNSTYVNNIRLDKNEVRFTIPQGTYEIRFYFLDNCSQMDIDICFNIKTFTSNIHRFVYGGGVRIKDIIFKDDITSVEDSRKISYDYTDADNTSRSSGAIDGNVKGLTKSYEKRLKEYLFSTPEVCNGGSLSVYNLDYVVHSKNLNVELTQGNYIGYKTVNVSEQGKGLTRYTFTSAQDYASPANVFNYPYAPAPNIDFKRGLLLKKQIFEDINGPSNITSLGKKLNETINTYALFDETIAPTYTLYNTPCEWKRFYNDTHASYLTNSPSHRLLQCLGNTNGSSCSTDCIISYNNCGNIPFNFLDNNVKAGWTNLITRETKDYYYDGTEATDPLTGEIISNKIVESRQEFDYDAINFQVKEQNTYYNESGVENHLQMKYYYPTSTGIYSASNLLSLNKLNEVLAVESYKNGKLTSTLVNSYNEFEPNLTVLEKVQVQKGEVGVSTSGSPINALANLEDRIIFYDYDDCGNPLEVSKADGTHIVYIWGYHKTQPIAKIENATYSQVSNQVANLQTKSNADNDRTAGTSGNEGLLRQALTTLRNSLPNAMVTTFTYDPLIGVTSITDPRGNVIYYHYDNFNRLEHVKDKDGNILSKNDYNYRTQN